MPKIATTNLQEGMILAEPVYDRKGRLILSKGLELELNHLRALKTWGINAVQILESSEEKQMNHSPLSRSSQEKIIKDYQILFSRTDTKSQFIQELFNQVVEREILKRAGGKAE